MQDLPTGEFKQLSPHVGRVIAPNPGPMTGAGTNTYIVGEDLQEGPVAIVDPGPAIDAHIDTLMREFGERVDSIVVTHTHPDHSPAAKRLAELSATKVYGSTAPADAMYQDQSFNADHEVSDDELLQLAGVNIRAVHTPGHVSNHYCYLVEEDGVLLTGDHLMNGSTVVIIPPAGVMKDYIESLQKLKNYPLKSLGPGHGDLMSEPLAVVDGIVQHRLRREQKVIDKLSLLGAVTLEKLTPVVYDDVNESLHFMASLSLSAHLIKLEAEGRARQQDTHWQMC
ncbi:MAG: MBL fold metallo-hydrolase [Pseudomonadales bacterium]